MGAVKCRGKGQFYDFLEIVLYSYSRTVGGVVFTLYRESITFCNRDSVHTTYERMINNSTKGSFNFGNFCENTLFRERKYDIKSNDHSEPAMCQPVL